jgi:hypothetical protein
VVTQVVSYATPLDTPPIATGFNENRFRVLASECPVETNVQIYLCRDQFETLTRVLKPNSIVVLGGSKGCWPTKAQSLARKLRRAGYEVLFTQPA